MQRIVNRLLKSEVKTAENEAAARSELSHTEMVWRRSTGTDNEVNRSFLRASENEL